MRAIEIEASVSVVQHGRVVVVGLNSRICLPGLPDHAVVVAAKRRIDIGGLDPEIAREGVSRADLYAAVSAAGVRHRRRPKKGVGPRAVARKRACVEITAGPWTIGAGIRDHAIREVVLFPPRVEIATVLEDARKPAVGAFEPDCERLAEELLDTDRKLVLGETAEVADRNSEVAGLNRSGGHLG